MFIIRRLNPRARAVVGAVLTLAGLVLLGLAATVASWLLIHGVITAAVGLVFCVAAYVGHKRATAVEPAGDAGGHTRVARGL